MSALERSIDEAPTEALHDAAIAELAALRAEAVALRAELDEAKKALSLFNADWAIAGDTCIGRCIGESNNGKQKGVAQLEFLALRAEVERLRGALRVVRAGRWHTTYSALAGEEVCQDCGKLTDEPHSPTCPVPSVLAVMEGLP
jgi:hypothetical protein